MDASAYVSPPPLSGTNFDVANEFRASEFALLVTPILQQHNLRNLTSPYRYLAVPTSLSFTFSDAV